MIVLKKFLKDKPAVLGFAIVLLCVLVAIFANQLAPYPADAFASHTERRLLPPGGEFLMGTDDLGRDVFSRLILGTRSAVTVGVLVVGIAMLLGVPAGLIAGYFGGWMAECIMRITDIFLSVPQLILALALAQLLKASLENAMLALALTYWPFFCRTVYAETRRLRVTVFVEALASLGVSAWRILFLHILPNALSPVIVRATVGMGFAVLTAASLSFLGMGATPPDPDWGLAIAASRGYLPDTWWSATFPGLAIFLVVLGFNLLGDGLRDIVDPRLRRSR